MLSEYLVIKLKQAKQWLRYIEGEHESHFPGTQHWKFNDYLLYYSFFNSKKDQIEEIRNSSNTLEAQTAYAKLVAAYKKTWVFRKPERLAILIRESHAIALLSPAKTIEKYLTLREEVLLIHTALSNAASAVDSAVDQAIERHRLG